VAALIGGIAIGLVPQEPDSSLHDVLTGGRSRSVTLTGQVEVLRPNRFLLRDGTGEIRLETCPPWYRLLPLRPGEKVRVVGDLAPRSRWRLDRPDFTVHRLSREDGTEIVLRFGGGSPPWRHETGQSDLTARRGP
jgi:hypothetical protein